MDGDVLAGTPLPGWSVFDALFIAWHDHPEAETSAGAFTDTPIARIQKIKRRGILLIAIVLLLSTASRWYRVPTTPNLPRGATSLSSTAKRSSSFLGGFRKSKLSHPTRPPGRQRPFSSKPLRLQASPARSAILQTLVQSRRSSFDSSLFFDSPDPTAQADGLTSRPILSQQLITAVIVHDPDWHIDNTQLVVNLASRYPFIREILVWNNDLDLQVDGKSLSVPKPADLGFESPSLCILNAPSSFSPLAAPVHRTVPSSHAKHLACGMSNHQICLFLSPASLPIHLDALYQSYLSSGPAFNQIVSIVNAEEYYRLQHLNFHNQNVDMHTGALFPVLATYKEDLPVSVPREAMVRKEYSRRFWRQMGTVTANIADQADIFWSLWMNTQPRLLVAPYLPIVELVAEPTKEDKQYQDASVLYALQLLHDVLKAQDPFLSPDPFPLAPSPPQSDARAPSHDDRAVFITNLSPFRIQAGDLLFPARRGSSGTRAGLSGPAGNFDPETSIANLDEYVEAWHKHAASIQSQDGQTVFPGAKEDFKYSLSWYAAVNGRHPTPTSSNSNATCWTSPSSPVKADYFGLHFIKAIDLGAEVDITVIGSRLLGNLVGAGEEDLTAESWEVWTRDGNVVASSASEESEWIRRRLPEPVKSQKIGEGPYWRHTFQLVPVSNDDTLLTTDEEEEGGVADDGDEDAGVFKQKRHLPSSSAPEQQKVGSIKLVSRDRKSQRIRVCGWQIDDWVI